MGVSLTRGASAKITIDTLVQVVLFLIGFAVIFGLLWLALDYTGKTFPSAAPIVPFARWAMVVLACFVLIFLVLDLMGHPVIVWRQRP